MAPNNTRVDPPSSFREHLRNNSEEEKISLKKTEYRRKFVWRNVFLFLYLHFAAVYGLKLIFTSARLYTSAYAYLLYVLGATGITAGAHRLWSHKSYSARLPLRIFLMFCNTLAFQNSIWEWSRDHRVHHKYTETDADPHNANRGFFFAHVGWLMMKKHPDVIAKGKHINLSDLESDPVVMFQKKYYRFLMPLVCFILPTLVPVYLWNESWSNAWFVATMFRYVFTLNITWLVNSAAHFFGDKPYDRYINPTENLLVAIGALGEGWHNYHHVFPWDYKTAELGHYRTNWTTGFIDFMAKLGMAYNLKTVSQEMIEKRVKRTGNGSHPYSPEFTMEKSPIEGDIWGWDDADMTKEDRDLAKIIKGTS